MRKILLGLSLTVPTFGLSQSDFRNGYVVTPTRDTVSGFINYRESDKVYESCEFKASREDVITTYSPAQIIAYGFRDDQLFESRPIKSEAGADEIVFLEVIVRGVVTLYKFRGGFWVEKEGQGLYQLINEVKEVDVDGKPAIRNTNKHIGILSMVLFDCEDIGPSVKKVRLSERSLTNLVERYNKCRGINPTVFKEKRPWIKSEVGIAGGLNISRIEFSTDYGVYRYLTGSFRKTISPMAGLSFNLLSPRLSERFSFTGMVLYAKSRYTDQSVLNIGSAVEKNDVLIELQQLKVPFGFEYSLPARRSIPFVGAGLSHTFHLKSSSNWKREVDYNNTVTVHHYEALAPKRGQFGFWGGLGVMKSITSKLSGSLEIRYEQTNGIALNYEGLDSRASNVQVIIKVRKNSEANRLIIRRTCRSVNRI